MRWPRSLLARNALLIAGLVIGGQLVSLAGYIAFVQLPRAAQLAELTARFVAVLEASLANAPARQLEWIVRDHGRAIVRTERRQPPESAPLPFLPRILVRRFTDAIVPRLDGRAVHFVRGEGDQLWIELRVADETLWFVTAADGVLVEQLTNWMIVSGIGAVIGLMGAFLIERRINRPLEALAEAARELGSGRTVQPLSENGPTELAAVSRAFNRMVADLAAVDRERAIMLAGISHDVRTPLTRVRLANELMRGQAEPALVERVATNLAHVDRILGQFLAFARDEATEKPVSVDLNRLVRERLNDQAEGTNGIWFQAGQMPELTVRPLAFGRALDNLIANARTHGARPIVVRTTLNADAVAIAIIDRGQGIAPEDIERYRQPFQRGRTTQSGSAGLGLAIVDRIVRLHGGVLMLGPAETGGFEARITLPI